MEPLEGWQERARDTASWADGVSAKFVELSDAICEAILRDDFEAYLEAMLNWLAGECEP
jgi:hypothetical protein